MIESDTTEVPLRVVVPRGDIVQCPDCAARMALPPRPLERVLCRIGWHRWGPWSVPKGFVLIRQVRACIACGLAAERIL